MPPEPGAGGPWRPEGMGMVYGPGRAGNGAFLPTLLLTTWRPSLTPAARALAQRIEAHVLLGATALAARQIAGGMSVRA
jgi:hypothetical protein